jgi:NADH-quinone oxidoreductase subunit L
MMKLIYWVPLLPLLGFLVNGMGRRKLSKSSVSLIGCGTVLVSFLISILIFLEVKAPGFQAHPFELFPFIRAGNLNISFSFLVDQLSVLFLLIITGVGTLIHIYSTAYMKEEEGPHYARYFAYLNLFVFSMLLLVLGSNYVVMFMGWEGVGLCSYLLIGYWFKNGEYNDAAKKAFIMNRIGDLGFLLAIFWMIGQYGSVNFSDVFSRAPETSLTVVTGITLLLFIGATGKSAQIPLYTWLPDAMAGPTPVSALIHAATMVTAGIYMIARSNILFTLAPLSQHVVAVVGLVTALFAATIALKQNDIKKVLAYSTVSQLGYMFLGLGVGAYTGAVFHVMTHAFFKALLFLGAGSVIHAMHHEQDIRNMGGLRRYLPVTHLTFLIGCLAIAGIPPFSGFFSKDEILAAAWVKSPLYYVFGVIGALMTAFYMFRLYALTFRGKFRGTHDQEHHLKESPSAMTVPLIVLAILAAVSGFLGVPEIFAPDAHWLHHFLSPIFEDSMQIAGPSMEMGHGTELALMFGVVAAIALVIVWAWRTYSRYEKSDAAETGLGKVLQDKWYVDEIYDAVVSRPLKSLSIFLDDVVERSGIDGIVNGVGRVVQYGSRQFRLLQSGQVGSYILIMVIATVLFFILQLFWKF